MVLQTSQIKEIADLLLDRKVGILPTDTIYGVHCKALDTELMTRVYELKDRPPKLPLITLISKVDELILFDITIGEFERKQIQKYWPGPNTLIFETDEGTTRSFRIPKNEFILSILEITGPLISTSANLHSMPSAKNVSEAMKYFSDRVDFYVDGGELNNPPSSVYDLTSGEVVKVR